MERAKKLTLKSSGPKMTLSSMSATRFYLGDTIRVKVLRADPDVDSATVFEHDIKLESVDRLVPM